MLEKLYIYPYPLAFPSTFFKFNGKYDRAAKMEIVHVCSIEGDEKEWHFKQFLCQFSVSNGRKREIKEIILNLFKDLQQAKLIKSFALIKTFLWFNLWVQIC